MISALSHHQRLSGNKLNFQNMKKVLFVLIVTFIFQLSVFSQIEKSTKTEIKNGYEYFVHEVQKGQTLYGISRLYSIPIDSLLVHNNNISGSLQIGQTIYIPSNKKITPIQNIDNNKPKVSSWHTVEQGETLFSIARKYNTSVDELKKMNPGISENLSISQRIEVPATSPLNNTIVQEKPKEAEKPKPIIEEENKKETAPNETAEKKPETPTTTEKPIVNQGIKSRNKITNEINIALMVPLNTQNANSININDIKSVTDIERNQSFKFIQFYLGFIEGAKQFQGKEIKININVYDVSDGVAAVKRITSASEFSKTHLIVGPLFSSTFSEAQKWANSNGVPIINPFTMQSNVINKSPSTFKLTCSDREKYLKLAKGIEQQYPDANVIIVYNKTKDTNSVSLLKSGFSKNRLKSNIKDIIFNERGINGINERYENNRPNIVITFLTGEATITNYVRRLYELKKDSIYLFSPSDWIVYDNIETEYLQALNAHFYGDYFVDYRNQKTIDFVRQFVTEYSTEPQVEFFGFQGYDIATYFIGLMMDYRDEWLTNINDGKHELTSMNFAFEKRSNDSGYENTQIQIFRLCNYEFIGFDIPCEMIREEIRY